MSGIGHSVLRREDDALLKGKGCFMDDLNVPDQLHVWFVRSTSPHAKLGGIETTAAIESPGVIAVFTGADLIEEPVGMLQGPSALANKDGTPIYVPAWPAMALDTVRYVGDTVAMVVAETRDAACDAAELVEVDYGELDSITDLRNATDRATVQLWPD